MILATTQSDGKKVYFDSETGKRYIPGREPGRREGRIPNDVIRFLSPKIERKSGITRNQQPVTHNDSPFKVPYRVVPADKPGWLVRLWLSIKSLFNGRK